MARERSLERFRMGPMVNILITEPEYFDRDAVRILRTLGKVTAQRLTKRKLENRIGDIEVLVIRIETVVDERLLKRARKLRLIGSATTGLDHIDVERTRKLGIKIISLHGAHTVPTAEHTVGLMLSLCRNSPWAFESLKGGRWQRHRFVGMQLQGKTLGIIGLGRIGKRVARYAKAFDMNVVYHDPYVASKVAQRTTLDALLKKSDVVSVHATLTNETDGMIDEKRLRMMKKSAFLINTARGRIVSQSALLRALDQGVIQGAALDVFEKEPLEGRRNPMASYARRGRNLILTPHLGASTREAAHHAGIEIAAGIKEELLGIVWVPSKKSASILVN